MHLRSVVETSAIRLVCRVCALWVLVALPLLYTGCTSDQEKLGEYCAELRELEKNAESCDDLGTSMSKLNKENEELLNKVRDMDPPTGEAADPWHRAMRACFEVHLEIGLGSCSENPKVQDALKAFGE